MIWNWYELVQRNVENLRWALLQAIDDSFRRFNMQVDERIGEVLAATKGAIKAALNLRRQESNRSQTELQRLRCAAEHLEELRIEFGRYLTNAAQECQRININPYT